MAFLSVVRKIYNPLGFSKGYNFILWFLSLGYIFGFSLARVYYLSYDGVFCNSNKAGTGAAPGECYYWTQYPFETGMKLHLYTILPAGILVVLQFVPAIRHKLILLHRINGYIVITLSLCASAGAIIVAQHAFGGDFATQTWTGTMVILTTLGYIMAWINIKLLQIDQHRAWMMRTWAWFATIITIRLIMISAASIISVDGNFYVTRPCAQINYVLGRGGTLHYYPTCISFFNGSNPDMRAIVLANFNSPDPIALGAALAVPFGTAGWLALVLHTIAIELYLRLTPAESDRLRQVSYERQLARGWKRPGYSGLTAERFGDSYAFVPVSDRIDGRLKDDHGMA